MNNHTILSVALAALAIGHSSILEAQGFQVRSNVERSLSLGNTRTNQITNPNVYDAGSSSIRVAARGLIGLVPVKPMLKLDRASNRIIASPVPAARGLTVLNPFIQTTTWGLVLRSSQSVNHKSNGQTQIMKINKTAVVPAVQTVKKTVFALKKRPYIAPKGLQKVAFTVAVHESGGVGESAFSRIHTVVEGQDSNGTRFKLPKNYNTMPNKRGVNNFVGDYNDWSGAGMTEDDLYNEFDFGAMFVGKPVVVEIEHRKIGTEWEAYIKAFHPADYTGEVEEDEEVPSAPTLELTE